MFSRTFLRRWFGPLPSTIRAAAAAAPRPAVRGRPGLEELESRLVMTARVSLAGGVLRAVCDNAATTVTLNQAGNTTILNGRGFANSSISRIEILGGTGKDTINILDTPAGKAVVVRAGAGNDTIRIGNPAKLASVRGALTVDAGSGDDDLRVENASASSRLVLNLGTGYDNTYIHASAARSVTVNDPTANGELGWVAVGGSKLNLTNSTDRITGAIHVNSAATLVVMDTADAARTITIDQDATGTNGRIVGLTAVPITYRAGELLDLGVEQDGHGGNTFVINNPAVRDYTSIGTGLGNDVVNLLATTTDVYSINFGGRDTFTIGSMGRAGGGTLADIRAKILVGDDQTGLTDLVVDNSGDLAAHDIVFSGSSAAMAAFGATASITGVSGEIAIYSPLASMKIHGGAHDTFTRLVNHDIPIEFTQDVAGLAAIRRRHAELSGDRGILGAAVGGLQATPDGRALFMDFQRGAIYWTAERGAIALHSGNWVKYQQYGRHTGPMGLPIAEETAILNNTAAVGRYERGAVYYSKATGLQALHGGNWLKYQELGAHNSGMGLPTSEETSILNGTAVMVRYQRGAIYWSKGTGVHAVHSGNWVKYQELGAHNGGMGLPTSDETRIKGGTAVVATYQRGAIYYIQATGRMLAVHSGNWVKYQETGAHDGPLGLPLSEEYSILGGRAVMARYEQGAIYYTPATGTILALHSGNWLKYQQLGGHDGPLRLPLSEHISILNDSAVMARYEGGAVYWSEATGIWAVQGLIGERYHALGGAAGLLGLPISDQDNAGDGFRVSRFQNGSLVFRNDVDVQLSFDRAEMLRLFGRVGQDGKVDQGEMNFLRQIVGDAKVYMPEYVRNLTNKVVNGDRANATTNGARQVEPLGNLLVESSGMHLDRLVAKWFRGTDRPLAKDEYGFYYAYGRSPGPLFGPSGPTVSDIVQGGTGDCYFLATLGAVVDRNPQAIRDMIIDNNDSTFTVRFYRSGRPEFVTVDRWFPSSLINQFVFANVGKAVSDPRAVLWVALLEKAYAQLNQSGWIGQDGTNTYEGIDSGRPGFAMSQITGGGSGDVAMSNVELELLGAAARNGKLIVLGSHKDKKDIVNPLIEASHAYTLVSADQNNEYFYLYNPWATDRQDISDGYLLLTRQEVLANFRTWTWGD